MWERLALALAVQSNPREHTMADKLVVYLAGPMTGIENFNYPAFEAAAKRWRASGYTVFAPNENFDGSLTETYSDYIRAALEMLVQCNAVAFLPNWEKSRGARLEAHIAQLMDYVLLDATTMLPLEAPTVGTLLLPDERESVLKEADRIVDGARQMAYGHPLDDFTKTAAMWAAIFGVPVTAEQVALAMVCVKMSRLRNTPDHRDSMVDVAGYIKTYQMVVDERKRRTGL